jgi:hypothetical protein
LDLLTPPDEILMMSQFLFIHTSFICIQTLTRFMHAFLHIANMPVLIEHAWAFTRTSLIAPSASL